MSSRLRAILACVVPLVLLSANPAQPDDAKKPGPPPKSPLTPDEEKKTLHLAPGLRIELVAAEPEIESPVACAYDEKGRLWVVEMRDYPNGPKPGDKPQGRIKLLEDKNSDGRYETAKIFADNLLFANGILPWGDGAIVTAAPHILFLHDTDGDGKEDRREILYEGFVAGNPQLRVSHPILGPDGWIYVANGLRGGEIRRHGKPDAPAIPIGGKDFRFDLINDRAEAIPGPGQFGNTFDRYGNRFVCDNRHHLRHVVFPVDPGKRNPLLAVPSLLHDTAGPADGPLNSGTRVYPLTRNWTTSNLHAGRFTAACGVYIDDGWAVGTGVQQVAFTCEPTGNLVHCEILEPNGATFKSKPWKEGVEFLASTDEWFRPVSLNAHPDGGMVVVDMYRAVIEHPEFMPVELKNRPDLMLGKERGRIWRIIPEGHKSSPVDRLDQWPTQKLIDQLQARGGEWGGNWKRQTAQRLLLTSDDPKVRAALEKTAESVAPSSGGPLIAWLLVAKGKVPKDLIKRMVTSGDDEVQIPAIQLMEATRTPDSPPPSELIDMAVLGVNLPVRFHAAIALGAWDDDLILKPLAHIAFRDAEDKWVRLAIASSSGKRTAKLVLSLLQSEAIQQFTNDGQILLIQELSELVGSKRDVTEISSLLSAAGKEKSAAFQRAVLTGLAEGVSRRGTPFPDFLTKMPDKAAAKLAGEMLAKAGAPATDAKAKEEERLAAIGLLAHSPWENAGKVLTQLHEADDTPPALRLAVIRSLAAHSKPEIAALLLEGWRTYTPSIRTEVLETLIRRPAWASALLDAVEKGTVKPGDIDPVRARRLIASRDKKLASRASKLLKSSLPADRKEVMDKYKAALTMEADAVRGREVFKKTCAACHSVAGIGVRVGPDISDTRTKTAEMLLTDVLNPNASIDGNSISYTVRTLDGKLLTGLIASESDSGITLKGENDKTDTILRADIEEIRSSGLSLMPEGLEKNMTVQEVADVIRFLKDWRYLDGQTPRGK